MHKNAETLQTSHYSKIIELYVTFTSFYTNPNLPSPNAYKFSAGLKQQFPPHVCNINTSLYRLEDLINVKDDYYPIVITIEAIYPPNYTGRAKKSI